MQNTALKPLAGAVAQATHRPTLRDYQQNLKNGVLGQWSAGVRNVLAVLPTGGGKTQILADIVSENRGASCVIAHRQELVLQISMALAAFAVRHRIIGPQKLVKFVVQRHVKKFGRSFYDSNAPVAVAGVKALTQKSRAAQLADWAQSVTLWVQDEAHHILRKNQWGAAAEMFPNAYGLGVTASPDRADGAGLGREADGVMDVIVEGPTQRDLINLGWLTDYVIYAPPSDMQVDDSMITASGDYSGKKLATAAKQSHIVGDVVAHYQRLAPGKKGVTFAPDVEVAQMIANKYEAAGVRAQCVSAKTDDAVRADAIGRLERGELNQLTNVDLFGEGFDLPTIDCVSMARHTASYALFVQQIGRGLRPVYARGMPLDTPAQRKAAIACGPKPHAIVIDHVGNVQRHAVARECPETGRVIIDVCFREWSLNRREKRSNGPSDAIPLTTCTNPDCVQVYERVKPRCPYCDHKPEPADRSSPEFVDGDLTELDPWALQTILADIDKKPAIPYGASAIVEMSQQKRHRERTEAQADLREAIAWWAGYQRSRHRSDAESYRRFWHTFGVDVATAQTLARKDAAALADRVNLKLAEYLT